MKKGQLRILAVTLAAIGITGFTAMEAFADNTIVDEWSLTDSSVTLPIKKTITALNISKVDHPTVTAYQIVKGTYNDNKLTDYVLCDGLGTLSITDKSQPTAEEITAIGAAIINNETSLTGIEMNRGTEVEGEPTVNYYAVVEPGLYIIMVTGTSEPIVYNPAIVAVNISDANNIGGAIGGSVDMTGYFKEGTDNAYLKSNKVSVNKSIVDSDNGTTSNGGSVAYGETVMFRIDEMTIPSYSQEYENPVYKITDTLEGTAFSGINELTVKVDNKVVSPANDTYTLTCKNKDGNTVNYTISDNKISAADATVFTIAFKDSFITDNGLKSVVVDYSTTVSDNAGYNFSENRNTAEVEYSNSPQSDSTAFVRDITYSYTFGISANIDAEDDNTDPSKNKSKIVNNEINKVSESSNEYVEVTDSKGNKINKNKKALGGAEFTLYTDIDMAQNHIVGTTTSDANGQVVFKGLDAGTYFLKESTAPGGYTLNPTVYRIEIISEFEGNGVLKSYSINTYVANTDGTRNGLPVGSAIYTNSGYTINADGSVTNNIDINTNNTPLAIVDTPLATLPSTGGVGTIALTTGASFGMAAFLTIHIVTGKKNKKNNKKVD